MTTLTSTARTPHHRHSAADSGARPSRRPGMRAFALGATLALVCAAIAWAAVAALHQDGASPPSATATTAAQPATTGTGAAATTAAGSGTTPAAGAHTGTSYPSGQDVLALQRDLGQLNYYESAVDGVYGPATVAAIKDFQRANGLTVDGIAGPSTMAKINQQMATGDNQMGPSGPPVKPANTTPANSTHTTPATPANHGTATGQSGTTSGGAAVSPSTGGAGA